MKKTLAEVKKEIRDLTGNKGYTNKISVSFSEDWDNEGEYTVFVNVEYVDDYFRSDFEAIVVEDEVTRKKAEQRARKLATSSLMTMAPKTEYVGEENC